MTYGAPITFKRTKGDRNRRILFSIILAALMVWGGLQFLASHPHWSPSKPPAGKERSEFHVPRESFTLDQLCLKMDSFPDEAEFVEWMNTQPASDGPRVFACLRRRSL
jgi:hypothetical protein